MSKELATAYATDWPSTPIRTDVAETANRASGYTTLGPTHITISSVDPGVRDTLSGEVRAQNKLYRRREFWHAVLFYTAGEVARQHLDGYTPYAMKNGLYDRGWPGAQEVLVLSNAG